MNDNTTKWVGLVALVIIVIAGLWWWFAQPTASTTNAPTSTNPADQVAVQDRSSDTVASVVGSLADSSEFAGLFSSTGVAAALTGKGPYTVFVSTDAGFGLLPKGTITGMTAAQQKRMVQYSVVSGRALDIDATNSGTIKALSGDMLNFNVQPSGLVQVNSSFALREYKTKNGIVYVVNQPLLPPVK